MQMPRYYVDLQIGSQHVNDVAEFDAKDDDDARVQAIRALPSVVQGRSDSSGEFRCVASVRDRRGIILFHIDLSLTFNSPE